jgi:arylsulfatase A-like enzyme
VVILADDQGWGDLSVNGNTNLSTPNIDSLAKDGAAFERFYVCPVCAPTRAEFLTGRYFPRTGVRGVSTGAERLNLDETILPQILRSAGYATGAFGKWHNGTQAPYHPNSRGFDEYYGFTSGHWGNYFNAELDHNGKPVRGKGYLADDLTGHAIEFIRRNRTRPFFCYLPLNTPHSPMQVPDRFYDRLANRDLPMRARADQPEEPAMTRAAMAMCENIDWNVGRMLDALQRGSLANDTIVIYFSDNGPNSWRWNGGMKGRKGSVDEGGVRAPLLIRWPGRIPGGARIPQIAGAIDLLPTLADLTGVPFQHPKALDGRSLKPLLTGDNASWPDRMIFSLQGKRASVRTQRFRLDSDGRLFDMQADPGQSRDVALQHAAEHRKLSQALDQWRAEMLPLIGPDDRPFTVGYAPETMLPARDGASTGSIKRSSIHPNCSFFTNWTSVDDQIRWNVEVGQTADYAAELWYTSGDPGSTIQLSFGDSQVRDKVSPSHNPPLLGKENDRVARTESYVKDFRPLRLGTIRLQKGRGVLNLQALQIAGKQVADVRYLRLIRS